jgi:hypothetical protein
VKGHLFRCLRVAAFLLITIVALAAGCSRPRPTSEGATAASDEVSHALIGKQITIRGRFSLLGKIDPYILVDNQQEVYLIENHSSGPFTWGKPYSDMDGKLVAATGILRFYQAPPAVPTPRAIQRVSDYFYFNLETTQLRLVEP